MIPGRYYSLIPGGYPLPYSYPSWILLSYPRWILQSYPRGISIHLYIIPGGYYSLIPGGYLFTYILSQVDITFLSRMDIVNYILSILQSYPKGISTHQFIIPAGYYYLIPGGYHSLIPGRYQFNNILSQVDITIFPRWISF